MNSEAENVHELSALRALDPVERRKLVRNFIPAQTPLDVEALMVIHSKSARDALVVATQSDDPELRIAVMQHAPFLFDESSKTESLIFALETAVPFGGLAATLDEVQRFHPAPIQEAMFCALLARPGNIAGHIATSLAVIHGKIKSRFDWSLRPMMLKFNTSDADERRQAFLTLYDHLNIANIPELEAVHRMADGMNHPQH